jgi:hypothetical protein
MEVSAKPYCGMTRTTGRFAASLTVATSGRVGCQFSSYDWQAFLKEHNLPICMNLIFA